MIFRKNHLDTEAEIRHFREQISALVTDNSRDSKQRDSK